ncbi:hypothetical protein T02_1731 [Trichinella nativa]|uniref:Uncharacterized protein n=6 Tax=Trichinella TaxID=6333 RepID=A0A0V1KZX1_9BILA|nr:hypothetical protein T05_2725 [Trichinella murrelli]KRX58225.1 hypothetical protein T09_5231 [Trichinella sp. T9]KRY11157.1 hypothetical protein T12_10552 [Trichinella patagoniensis]KRY47847.1 hypothetical protein T03_17871 [Trichinella britovi]KRZ52858.1 hypothetical protein T02_1731 [Trichinella nativa]
MYEPKATMGRLSIWVMQERAFIEKRTGNIHVMTSVIPFVISAAIEAFINRSTLQSKAVTGSIFYDGD